MKPITERWGGVVELPWIGSTLRLESPQMALGVKLENLDLAMLAEVPPDATAAQLFAARDQLIDRIMQDIEAHLELLITDKRIRAAIKEDHYTGIAWRWPIEPIHLSIHWTAAPNEHRQRQQATLDQWITWPADAAPLAVAEWIKSRFAEIKKKRKQPEDINTLAEWADGVISLLKSGGSFPNVRKFGELWIGINAVSAKQLPTRPNAFDRKLGLMRDPSGKVESTIESLPVDRPVIFTLTTCAMIYLAEQQIEAGRRIPLAAVSTDKAHYGFVESLALTKLRPEGGLKTRRDPDASRVYLSLPGGQVQLFLPFDLPLHEQVIMALKKTLKQKDFFRHWLALHAQLHNQGGRSGQIRWTADQHLDAMGITDDRLRKKYRTDAEKIMVALTKIKLVVDTSETIIEGEIFSSFREKSKKDNTLEGVWLAINPFLYSGVRNPETNALGTNFFTVPAILAQVDHSKFPYIAELGMRLAFRLKWHIDDCRAKNKTDLALYYSAKILLEMAGIPITPDRPGRMWQRLETTLTKLVELKNAAGVEEPYLDSWKWITYERTLPGTIALTPAKHIKNFMIHGVPPLELPPVTIPLTGTELLAWRNARGMSQAELARRLGIHSRTIIRAEKKPAAPLPKPLRDKLTAARIK